MIIDVPSAAIEPFEPHGIPQLHSPSIASAVQLALKKVFDFINRTGSVGDSCLVIEGMRFIIEKRLYNAGAKFVRVVIRGPYTDTEIPHCGVSVHYQIPGEKRRHHMGGPVWSKGGFR